MTARVVDLDAYREQRRAELLAEADVLSDSDVVDCCDWCSVATLVEELRDASVVFDELPGGEPLVGHICQACIDAEHEARERADTDGVYHGANYER